VVSETAASSVDLMVRVWIADAYQERPVYHRVLEASKLALDAAGIQIPFPHLQLFVDDVEGRVIEKVSHLANGGEARHAFESLVGQAESRHVGYLVGYLWGTEPDLQ
jgi:small-conductance mechanosensitive channel